MFCTEMRYKLDVIMLIMYLYVLFTLLIITHNKRSHQITIKPRISIETDVESMETDTDKTYVGTSAEINPVLEKITWFISKLTRLDLPLFPTYSVGR